MGYDHVGLERRLGSLTMKTICIICKKLICETDDEPDLVSHGIHESCCEEFYNREIEQHPVRNDKTPCLPEPRKISKQ